MKSTTGTPAASSCGTRGRTIRFPARGAPWLPPHHQKQADPRQRRTQRPVTGQGQQEVLGGTGPCRQQRADSGAGPLGCSRKSPPPPVLHSRPSSRVTQPRDRIGVMQEQNRHHHTSAPPGMAGAAIGTPPVAEDHVDAFTADQRGAPSGWRPQLNSCHESFAQPPGPVKPPARTDQGLRAGTSSRSRRSGTPSHHAPEKLGGSARPRPEAGRDVHQCRWRRSEAGIMGLFNAPSVQAKRA